MFDWRLIHFWATVANLALGLAVIRSRFSSVQWVQLGFLDLAAVQNVGYYGVVGFSKQDWQACDAVTACLWMFMCFAVATERSVLNALYALLCAVLFAAIVTEYYIAEPNFIGDTVTANAMYGLRAWADINLTALLTCWLLIRHILSASANPTGEKHAQQIATRRRPE